MTETTPSSVSDQAIPSLLRSFPRWILWHQETQPDGKATKVPQASTKKPEQWSPWQQVEATPRSPQGGIGFVLTGPVLIGGFQLIALDCDGCRDPNSGELAPWVRALLDGAGFAEITPSGTGVRIWLLTDPGLRLAHAKLRMPKGPDVPKTPECQVFGLGPAGYVTVSGWPLTGHEGEIAYWPHERLHEVFGAVGSGTGCAADGATSLGGLPEGAGAAPGHEEILQALAAHPAGLALLAGAWEGLVPRKPGPDGKTPPATSSEAFWKLTQLVLRASRGHGLVAAKFLVRNCGEAWERANPKYGKLSWVEGEVARAAAKTNAGKVAEMAFEPLSGTGEGGAGGSLFDDEEPAQQPGALLIPADRFVAQAGTQMFLVKNLLARTGVSLFFGAPASGKTPFVMSLALAVAGGVQQWFGRKVMRHGTVVYMVGEDSSGVGHRLKAECAARGWGLDSIAKTLLFTARPGRLIEMADAANWVREIKAVVGDGDLAMLVIDTQNQNFGAGSENDAEDMLAFLMSLRFLSETLRCAIVMTHHPGHMNTDRARGHSSLEAAVESRFEVKATKEEDGSVSVAACDHKHKNWADPGVLQATLVPRVVYTDSDGDAVTAITLVEGGSTAFMRDGELQKLLALVAEQEANGKVKLPERRMAELLGWSRRQVREGINRAMVHGALSKTDEKSKNPAYVLTATGLAIVESLGPKSLDQATFCRQSESLVQTPWTKPDQSLLD